MRRNWKTGFTVLRATPTVAVVPRRPRHQECDAYYHIVSRGNNKQVIFDEELRRLFLHTLQGVARAHDWRVLAFALMRNHYHLVVKIGARGLSDGMCVLNTRFARASNGRFERINHCFGRRFWSAHLETEHHLLNSVRYCHWNPPRAQVCAEPGDSAWTSYRASVGLDRPHPVVAHAALLELFDANPAHARRALSDFVAEGHVRCQAPWDGPAAT
jgi:REP element-mobilizing transposase RayT